MRVHPARWSERWPAAGSGTPKAADLPAPLRATLTAPALPPPPPAAREVTRWITRHPDHLTEDQTAQLSRIKARSPQLTATAGHGTAFAR